MKDQESKKVVLVTGATGGIGQACIRHLLQTGHQVVGCDRQAGGPDDLPADDFLMVEGDISIPADCQKAVDTALDRFGRLDALIHWAGIHTTRTWKELTADEMNRILGVNVTGSFLIAQAAAQAMAAQGEGGSIVMTGSTSVIHGSTGGAAGHGGPAYVASKAAITGLIRSLARSLGEHQIRVNGVSPGVTDTPMISKYSPENFELQAQLCPLGRIGTPEDIAEAGCFLISDSARYISGEMIIVNGGAVFG